MAAFRARLAVGLGVALLAWLIGPAAALPGGADTVRYGTGKFTVSCTSSGQVCSPPERLKVDVKNERVRIERIRYVAATTHCSAGRILISLDRERLGATDFVNAGERATVDKLKVTLDPGLHKFAFRIEGRTGGCNAGFVGSWGGKITLKGERL